MPETLTTADGEKLDLDQADAQFAAAMAAPGPAEPEAPAPPHRGPVDPEAPYGRKVDGTPKKSRGGRPPKPREIAAPKEASKPAGTAQPSAAQSYAHGLAEFLGGIQLALAVIPVPSDPIRVHLRYQAAILEQTGDGLATGVGTIAEHNAMVRWGVEKLTQDGGAWIFPAAMAIAPFAVSTVMLWRAPVTPEMAAGAEQIQDEAMARLKAELGLDLAGDIRPEETQQQPAAA